MISSRATAPYRQHMLAGMFASSSVRVAHVAGKLVSADRRFLFA